jgi:hypothetical protein
MTSGLAADWRRIGGGLAAQNGVNERRSPFARIEICFIR